MERGRELSDRVEQTPSRWMAAAAAAAILVAVASCSPAPKEGAAPASAGAPAAAASASSAPGEFTPTATVQDIMVSMVDPKADNIWNSVATVVTLEGTEEKRPRTEEDWVALRHDAIILVEATNLLLMPRQVAK